MESSLLNLDGAEYVNRYPELLKAVRDSAFSNDRPVKISTKRCFYPKLGTYQVTVDNDSGAALVPNKFYYGVSSGGEFIASVRDDETLTLEVEAVYEYLNFSDVTYSLPYGLSDLKAHVKTHREHSYFLLYPLNVLLFGAADIDSNGLRGTLENYLNQTELVIDVFEDFDRFDFRAWGGSSNVLISDDWVTGSLGKPSFKPGSILGELTSERHYRQGFISLACSSMDSLSWASSGEFSRFFSETGVFEYACDIYIDALSNVTTRYKAWVGYGRAHATTREMDRGISIFYTDAENAGRFIVRYSKNGTVTDYNTSVTAVAETWYTLRLTRNSVNIEVRINGTLITSIPVSSLPTSTADCSGLGYIIGTTLTSGVSARVASDRYSLFATSHRP